MGRQRARKHSRCMHACMNNNACNSPHTSSRHPFPSPLSVLRMSIASDGSLRNELRCWEYYRHPHSDFSSVEGARACMDGHNAANCDEPISSAERGGAGGLTLRFARSREEGEVEGGWAGRGNVQRLCRPEVLPVLTVEKFSQPFPQNLLFGKFLFRVST